MLLRLPIILSEKATYQLFLLTKQQDNSVESKAGRKSRNLLDSERRIP